MTVVIDIDWLCSLDCSEISKVVNELKQKGLLKLLTDSKTRRRILYNLLRVFKYYHLHYELKDIYEGKKYTIQRFLTCKRPYGFDTYYLFFDWSNSKCYLIIQHCYLELDYNTYDIYELVNWFI